MRPGQQAPESARVISVDVLAISCFNEARAASPGIPIETGNGADPAERFNEARAASPGILPPVRTNPADSAASMRPGQQAPESLVWRAGDNDSGKASMRPGQQAPESAD